MIIVFKIVHKEKDCPLVALRIVCNDCGYPFCEARYGSVGEYLAANEDSTDFQLEANKSKQVTNQELYNKQPEQE